MYPRIKKSYSTSDIEPMDKIVPYLKIGAGHRYPIEFEKEIRRIEELFDAGEIDARQRDEMINAPMEDLEEYTGSGGRPRGSFIKNPGKRKAMDDRGLMMNKGGNVNYGLGGALLKLGSNLAQGKGFGSGALKGVGRAAFTPGSGIGAGTELAGNLLQKSKNPALQGIGKGLGIVSNFAPGGGGPLAALGGLAGGGAGGAGGIGGALAGLAGGGGGGGGLLNMASQFLGEQGMAVPNKNKNVKTIKHSMAAGGYSYPAMRGVKLMKGGAVYADNGTVTPYRGDYSDQVEYVMHGGDDPSGGYFMVGAQTPMDFKGFTDYLVESGMSRPMAIQEAGRYKSAGVAYEPEFTGEASSEATPYTTERATQKASDLINEANLLMKRGGAENEKRAEELMKLAEKYRGSKGREFRKVVASGSTAPDPSMMSFLGGLSRMEGPERD